METVFMFVEMSDNPNEGALEGASELTDQAVQFTEARLDSPSQAQSLFQGDLSAGVPNEFSQVSIGQDAISFAPGSDSMSALPGTDRIGAMTGALGDQISSLIQSIMQTPGPMGLLGQLFQFLSSLFGSLVKAFDPSIIAQQAQSAFDLKKLMMQA